VAKVIPILRSGDFEDPVINRPISLLPILSKVCKKTSLSSICSFFEQLGKISKFQSGNRQAHSTETALLHFSEEILKNMDWKKISLIVLLDMSKAIDSIWDERLLMKLHNISVSTSCLTWFESYFTQRSQFVRIEDVTTDILPVRVPQGSILGPVLFTVYVNDPLSVVVKR